MRLKKYINESRNDNVVIDDFITYIEDNGFDIKDITKFYKACGNKSIYRGSRDPDIGDFKIKESHKKRKPKDTSVKVHNELNKIFEAKFGWPVRNGVFATSDKQEVGAYGMGYYFYPLGDYDYCWSPTIMDINDQWPLQSIGDEHKMKMYYAMIKDTDERRVERAIAHGDKTYIPNHYLLGDKPYELDLESYKTFKESLYDLVERIILKTYTNKNLKKAATSKKEISFNCEYYFLSAINLAERL